MLSNVVLPEEAIKAQRPVVRELLYKLEKADPDESRRIRRELRRLGFYLSRPLRGFDKKKRLKDREKISRRLEEERKFKRRKKLGISEPKVDQVLDTAQQLVLAKYRTVREIRDRLLELYPKITTERAEEAAEKALGHGENPRRTTIRGWGQLPRARGLTGYEKRFWKKFALERRKKLLKNWKEPRGTSFKTPFEDAADLLELGYKPIDILSIIRRKWKMSVVDLKSVIRDIHRDPILSKRWSSALKENPARGMDNPPVVIYDKVLAIEAEKGKRSVFPGEKFRHDFKGKTGAQAFGLPSGDLLIKSKTGKRLWKNFDY